MSQSKKELTKHDVYNFMQLPEKEWVTVVDVFPRIMRGYYSLNRLVDAGLVESKFENKEWYFKSKMPQEQFKTLYKKYF